MKDEHHRKVCAFCLGGGVGHRTTVHGIENIPGDLGKLVRRIARAIDMKTGGLMANGITSIVFPHWELQPIHLYVRTFKRK